MGAAYGSCKCYQVDQGVDQADTVGTSEVAVDKKQNMTPMARLPDEMDSYTSLKDLPSAEQAERWEGVYEKDGAVIATISGNKVEWVQSGHSTVYKIKSKTEIAVSLPQGFGTMIGTLQSDGSILFNDEMTWTRPQTNGKAAAKESNDDATTGVKSSSEEEKRQSTSASEDDSLVKEDELTSKQRDSEENVKDEVQSSREESKERQSDKVVEPSKSKALSSKEDEQSGKPGILASDSDEEVMKVAETRSSASIDSPRDIEVSDSPQFETIEDYKSSTIVSRGRSNRIWTESEEKEEEVIINPKKEPEVKTQAKQLPLMGAESAAREITKIMGQVTKAGTVIPSPVQQKRLKELAVLTKGGKAPASATSPKKEINQKQQNLSAEDELAQVMKATQGRNPTRDENKRIQELMKQIHDEAEKKKETERKQKEEEERKKREEEKKREQERQEAERKKREEEEKAEQARLEAERIKKQAEEKARREREEAERKRKEEEAEAERKRKEEEAEAERIKQEEERKQREAEEAKKRAREEKERKRREKQKEEEERQKRKAEERRKRTNEVLKKQEEKTEDNEVSTLATPKRKRKKKKQRKSSDPYEYDNEQVVEWIRNLGIILPTDVMVKKAEKYNVVGSELLFLKNSEMKKRLGLKSKIHKSTFEKHLKTLQEKSEQFKNGATKLVVDGPSVSPSPGGPSVSISASKSRSKSIDPPTKEVSTEDREREPDKNLSPKKKKKAKSVHSRIAGLTIPMGRAPPKKKKQTKAPVEPQRDLAEKKAVIKGTRRKRRKTANKLGANLGDL